MRFAGKNRSAWALLENPDKLPIFGNSGQLGTTLIDPFIVQFPARTSDKIDTGPARDDHPHRFRPGAR